MTVTLCLYSIRKKNAGIVKRARYAVHFATGYIMATDMQCTVRVDTIQCVVTDTVSRAGVRVRFALFAA